MDVLATRDGTVLTPGPVSLSALQPHTVGVVRQVTRGAAGADAWLERRLVELGFVAGERVEVLSQVRPGGDPFVIRVGDTTFALRRREVETVWVDVDPTAAAP